MQKVQFLKHFSYTRIFGLILTSHRTLYEGSLTTELISNTNHKVLEAVYPKLLIKAKGQQSVMRIKSNKQNKVGFWTWHCILSPQTSWLVNAALNELQMRGCGNSSDLSPTLHKSPHSTNTSAVKKYPLATGVLQTAGAGGWVISQLERGAKSSVSLQWPFVTTVLNKMN